MVVAIIARRFVNEANDYLGILHEYIHM